MDIVVCVKRVPDVSEAEVAIDRNGKSIRTDDLAFDINEWDSYALEEAVLLKEKLGGTVTAVTMGPEDADEVLRRCLAVGADAAMHLDDDSFEGGDGATTATALAAAIKGLTYDLVLTGATASDDGFTQVGPALAQLLGIPHATFVVGMEIDGAAARVRRELEEGMEEMVELQLPALVTIQTGINEPRYVPVAGIRRAARRDIPVIGVKQLGLRPEDVGGSGARVELLELLPPEAGQAGEMLTGRVESVVERLVAILGGKGWL